MKNSKGFTLIEVVVVTLVIAALALLVAPSFKNSAITNNIEKAKMGLTEYTNAIKLYVENYPGKAHYMTGVLNEAKFQYLTEDISQSGYIVWPNTAGRWGRGPVVGDNYTLYGLDCKFGYKVGERTVLTEAACNFKSYDNEEPECYKFKIYRENPGVIKKSVGGSCDDF